MSFNRIPLSCFLLKQNIPPTGTPIGLRLNLIDIPPLRSRHALYLRNAHVRAFPDKHRRIYSETSLSSLFLNKVFSVQCVFT